MPACFPSWGTNPNGPERARPHRYPDPEAPQVPAEAEHRSGGPPASPCGKVKGYIPPPPDWSQMNTFFGVEQPWFSDA